MTKKRDFLFYFTKYAYPLGRIVLNCRQVGRHGKRTRHAQNAADGGKWNDFANHSGPVWLYSVRHAAWFCLAARHDDHGHSANTD